MEDLDPVLIPRIDETQIYVNDENEIVIYQSNGMDDPSVVIIPTMFIDAVIGRLQAIKRGIEES